MADWWMSSLGALDFGEDGGALGPPAVGFGREIAPGEIGFDRPGQFLDAAEAARAHHLRGEIGKEALDQIQPRTGGGRKVEVEARVLGQRGAQQLWTSTQHRGPNFNQPPGIFPLPFALAPIAGRG